MGSGPGRPVKTHGPRHGPGGAALTEPASNGPRPGPAHQISRGWAAARPMPRPDPAITFSRVHGPARLGPLKFQKSRPGPSQFQQLRPGPARPGPDKRPVTSQVVLFVCFCFRLEFCLFAVVVLLFTTSWMMLVSRA